ncbi:flagellar biosynthesis protein FlgA [Micromonospora costi]|uniref:Flagellar biosynthesis protein FlgA n=1 Tax=Micromonospora costi TaxID=1530042 RepID=A0A3B0AD49_9ACTN|nr:flagellar biosynthesis protein FlgA [Micromonospora costi]RKN58492.1 flagellar biosynthesis protein FlgA [Micromonospora costi]
MAGAETAALRPVRRPRLPRNSTLLRAALVAVLLGLAAAVLHTPAGCPPPPGGAPAVTSPSGAPRERSGVAGETVDATASPGRDADPTGSNAATATGRDAEIPAGRGTGTGQPPGRGPLPLPAGSVGVPVRLAEPAALSVVRPGTRVDLLAAPPAGPPGEANLLASRALVLDVVGAGATDGSAALYLALQPEQAQRAVGQPEGSRFAIVVRE